MDLECISYVMIAIIKLKKKNVGLMIMSSSPSSISVYLLLLLPLFPSFYFTVLLQVLKFPKLCNAYRFLGK